MNGKELLELYYEDIISALSMLTNADIEKLKKKDYCIDISVKRKNTKKNISNINIEIDFEQVLKEISKCNSKNDSKNILARCFTQKHDLVNFAKYLDVSVQLKDKKEVIEDRIIEATIGAILRSNAIQGKDTRE